MSKSDFNNSGNEEPLFMVIANSDADFKKAYAMASRTWPRFLERLQKRDGEYFGAKLRFRDPEESERLGEDQFLFLWLTDVHYHEDELIFSGEFFEVPTELKKWHQVGERLGFEGEDIFDWMVITEDGRLFGGYTLRVTRSKLPEEEKADYDRYVGVKVYEPVEG